MKRFAIPAVMIVLLGIAVLAQLGVVNERGDAGIKNPIYRKSADQVSRAEYVTSFGMYLPKGEFALSAARFLGGLQADAYWLKAAQYISKAFDDPALKTRFLGDLYIAMIDTDPYWSSAAVTAVNAISGVTTQNDQAIQVVDKALKARPEDWRLWYSAMALYLFWPGHKAEAIRFARMGARRPGASVALLDAANTLASEDGNYRLAVDIAKERLQKYGLNSMLGGIAWRDYLEHNSRYLQYQYQGAIDKFHKDKNRFPENLDELVSSGYITNGLAPEPYGLGWIYDSAKGTIISKGLGILDGARMAIIIQTMLHEYSGKYGHMPETLKVLFDNYRFPESEIDGIRYFGNPPKLVPHPVIGNWLYDPNKSPAIELPPDMTMKYIMGVGNKIRDELLMGTVPAFKKPGE